MAVTTDFTATSLKHSRTGPGAGALGTIVACHGYNASSRQWMQYATSGAPTIPIEAGLLADQGFNVYAYDFKVGAGGTTSIPSPATTTALSQAISDARSDSGDATVSLLGWSGGGGIILAGLCADSSLPAQVDRVVWNNPLLDNDFAYGLSTPYSTAVTPAAVWETDLDNLWSGNYNANVTTPYRLKNAYTSYKNLNIRTYISGALDDSVLPPELVPWWVGQAGNPAHFILRQPVAGGHTFGVPNLDEVIDFMRGHV